jgi:hypothetical protein
MKKRRTIVVSCKQISQALGCTLASLGSQDWFGVNAVIKPVAIVNDEIEYLG